MSKSILEEAKDKVKNKQKENTMKTPKKTIIITVILTLVSIATIGGLLYTGFQYGISYEKSKNAEVHSQVQALTAVTKK